MYQSRVVTPLVFLAICACGNSKTPDSSPNSPIDAGAMDSGSPSDAGASDAGEVDNPQPHTAGQGGSTSSTEHMDAGHSEGGHGGAAGSVVPHGGAGEGGAAGRAVYAAAGSGGNAGSSESAAGTGGVGGTSSAGAGGSAAAGSAGYGAAGSGNAGAGGTAGAGGSGSTICSGPPGLYSDDQCSVLSPGIRTYTPQFPLWSDGAIKTRYVYLPPGTTIDVSEADHWQFPVGTKFYKEFRSPDNTLRVETRVMEKILATNSTSGWTFDTYVWSADQKSAHVETAGVTNALGTGLDVPAREQCTQCHNHSDYPRDMVNGFQAIQLNWSGAGVTLQSLITDQTLTGYRADITTAAVIPGRNATETAAFGYFHGNCGHCHSLNEDAPHNMTLLTSVGVSLASQLAWTTTVCFYPHTPTESYATQRIAVGDPSNSAIYNRDSVRGLQHPAATPVDAGPALDGPDDSIQMPPIATKVVDSAAMATEAAWINSLTGCTP